MGGICSRCARRRSLSGQSLDGSNVRSEKPGTQYRSACRPSCTECPSVQGDRPGRREDGEAAARTPARRDHQHPLGIVAHGLERVRIWPVGTCIFFDIACSSHAGAYPGHPMRRSPSRACSTKSCGEATSWTRNLCASSLGKECVYCTFSFSV